jgi:P4 family phage/plasmid primase-like protien
VGWPMTASRDTAADYARRGWSPIPVPRREKRPAQKGWPDLRIPEHDVVGHFSQLPTNIGVLLGEASCELVDVDLDCPESCDLASAILPSTNSVFGRQSKPTSHYLYRSPISSQRFKDPETGEMLLEIRSTGHQTIFPGSLHPSGEAVEWYEDGPVAQIEPSALLLAASKLAAASLLARHWPKEGGRHDAQLTVCAFLVRSGWSIEQTASFVAGVVGAAGGDAHYEKRLYTAQDAARRQSDGQALRGWTAFCELFGEKIAQRASEWLGLSRSSDKRANQGEAALGSPSILKHGSDVEIAKRLYDDLRGSYGEVIFDEGRVWKFDDICWVPINDRDLRLGVYRYDGVGYGIKSAAVKLSKTQINSILYEFSVVSAQENFFRNSKTGINCASGFISFDETGYATLMQHSPDHRSRYSVPGNWPSNGDEDELEKTLLVTLLRGAFLGDPDAEKKIDLVAEVAASAALGIGTKLKQPLAVVLLGRTAENGKSQILDLMRGALAEEAVSSLPPQRFGDEKYVIQLAGKNLNASDELSSARAIGSDAFKIIITGDPTSARDVYSPVVQFRASAQHVFATNALPAFQGGMDRGVRRRLRVITFNRTVPDEERIPGIGARICREEPDLLLDYLVQGASRLIRQSAFSCPASSLEAEREWLVDADPVLLWLEEEVRIDATAPPVLVGDAYDAFTRWAAQSGFRNERLPTRNTFSQRLRAAEPSISSKRTSYGRYLVGLRLLQSRPAASSFTSGGGYR